MICQGEFSNHVAQQILTIIRQTPEITVEYVSFPLVANAAPGLSGSHPDICPVCDVSGWRHSKGEKKGGARPRWESTASSFDCASKLEDTRLSAQQLIEVKVKLIKQQSRPLFKTKNT